MSKHKANNHKANYKRKPDTNKPDTLKTDKPDTVKTDKPDTTLVTTISKSEEDIERLVDNDTGKLVPTEEDKLKIEAVKEAQRIYRAKRLEAQEAMRTAKLAFEALDGSTALKAIKEELEGKIEAKQVEVTKAREAFNTLVSEYNSLTEEYKALTGITKKALKANGKGTANISANGNWLPTVTALDNKSVKVVVKYKPTNTIFEDTLYAGNSGLISHKNWLELRERFYQNDGKTPDTDAPDTIKPKSVFYDLYQSLDTNAKANFRAFLYPRLYKAISEVKAIADKLI